MVCMVEFTKCWWLCFQSAFHCCPLHPHFYSLFQQELWGRQGWVGLPPHFTDSHTKEELLLRGHGRGYWPAWPEISPACSLLGLSLSSLLWPGSPLLSHRGVRSPAATWNGSTSSPCRVYPTGCRARESRSQCCEWGTSKDGRSPAQPQPTQLEPPGHASPGSSSGWILKDGGGLELGLVITLAFILPLVLNRQPWPGPQSESFTFFLWQVFCRTGSLGQSRLPEATTLRCSLQEEEGLSPTSTFFWSVLAGYYHIRTAALDICCLITVCWLNSNRPPLSLVSYYCHVVFFKAHTASWQYFTWCCLFYEYHYVH